MSGKTFKEFDKRVMDCQKDSKPIEEYTFINLALKNVETYARLVCTCERYCVPIAGMLDQQRERACACGHSGEWAYSRSCRCGAYEAANEVANKLLTKLLMKLVSMPICPLEH